MKKIIILILVVLLGIMLLSLLPNNTDAPENQNEQEGAEESMGEKMTKNVNVDSGKQEITDSITSDVNFNIVIRGNLSDVTNGEDVRGINTGGIAIGGASIGVQDNMFATLAIIEKLPDPKGDDFYEGWVVRRGENFSAISTGKLEKLEGNVWVNRYLTNTDISDHDFYVLTLEPNDGDPAPADHIVEGEMKKIDN